MFNAKRMILNLKAKTGMRTTKDLAEYLAMPSVTVSYMEKTNNPTIKTLSAMADAADVDLDVLVGMGVVSDE